MEGDLTLGGEQAIQYRDDVLYSCTPETYITLLTSVTPMNSIKIKNKRRTFFAYRFFHSTTFFWVQFPSCGSVSHTVIS